jgi:hypothetical protein
MTQPTPPSRFTFDPTINISHLLTVAGLLIIGFTAYAALVQRITVVEQRNGTVEERIVDQDNRTNNTLAEIKRDVRETNIAVNALARELAKGRQ